MKTEVEIIDSNVVVKFDVTTNYTAVIKLSPNETRNFKAQLEAVLKTIAQEDKD